MAPLAVGTQTGGSIIRPASFCGVVGFKPTFGAIARTGILPQSQTLDTVGVFARSAADAALLAEVLYGADAGDPQSVAGPFPRLLDLTLTPPPVALTFAFLRPIGWDQADPQLHAAFAELTEAYFVRNDFFPFNREELRQYDPVGYAMIESVWSQ